MSTMRCPGMAMAALALMLVAGCGGGSASSGGGESFDQQVQRALKQSSPDSRARQLVAIAQKQLAAQDRGGAKRTLSLAIEAAKEISEPVSKVSTLGSLARTNGEAGMRSDGLRAVEAAKEELVNFDNDEARARSLTRLALAEGALDERGQAGATLKQAEGLLAGMEAANPLAQAAQVTVMVQIARAYHGIEFPADSERMVAQALAAAESIEQIRARSRAIANIAVGQHRMGKADASKATFEQAVEVAKSIDDPLPKAHAMVDIAGEYASIDQEVAAKQLLDEAELVAVDIGQPDLRQEVKDKIQKQLAELYQ